MTIRLPSLTSLRAFEAAARLRSFKKAAEELSVTATAVSHRIRALEEFLEHPLFLRKVRAVELTPDGLTLFTAVHSGFETIAVAIKQIQKPRRQSVMLSTTPAFATKWLIPRLASFQEIYPDIDLHIHASNTPVDLYSGTVDLAVRYGIGQYTGEIATLLLEDHFAPVASPTLLTSISRDASQWPLIHFDWHHSLPVDLTWSVWAQASGLKPADLPRGIRYYEESHAIQAAIAGQGVALLSLLLIQEELRLGVLQVVTEPTLKGMTYHVLKSSQYPVSEAATTVENWLLRIAHQKTAE
ncbi:LysR family transcriptional regulator [Xenorhabdus mauleonii]|uniref:LysR family transcriptional regulator n=1 Tax=Xenorhabdus mauleonii TaxID=351675 RepID=A0A1I3SDT3_9GAMM|nr:LysR substrate-binding domain-containing protein [Xenorhabdus mauleonii]PHM39112.1 LysR family transcriptional regulator [Xenorhabdus mauleonii]SFJ55687.1 LysR family transcriptional regulator, glycine cleavage system transcriptional activator [Xenorhabdus mauleonii]